MKSIKHRLNRLRCWWAGCDPDMYAISAHGDHMLVPCVHCGAPDVSYADLVGDTRCHRFLDRIYWLRWTLFRRWYPAKCTECGERYGHKDDCDGIPF